MDTRLRPKTFDEMVAMHRSALPPHELVDTDAGMLENKSLIRAMADALAIISTSMLVSGMTLDEITEFTIRRAQELFPRGTTDGQTESRRQRQAQE